MEVVIMYNYNELINRYNQIDSSTSQEEIKKLMQDMEKFVSEDHPREEKVKFAGPLGLLESLGFLIDE